ncbi:AraC family transcriptional regulator [Paenibacillus sp. 1P07SE]|uniref:helix-turn-helix transcriptional regulator n=1 Tax=Paenibacillus sp. 1P07SE TaxID=3132209 RepID=UPI0039A55E25
MAILHIPIHEPVTYLSGGQFLSTGTWVHRERTIDSYELILGISEVMYFQIHDRLYELAPGDVLLLCPDERHRGYRPSPANLSFYWFHFQCPVPPAALSEVQEKTCHDHPGAEDVLLIPTYIQSPMPARLHILAQQLLHVGIGRYHHPRAADFFLTSLLIELSQQYVQQRQLTEERITDHSFPRMLEWLRLHACDKQLSVERVAELFTYNKDYLSRMFKRRMGTNMLSYIHRLKLDRAKDLLSRTPLNIKEIADRVGLEDDKQLIKLFKRYEGLTPTQYRKAFILTYMNDD